MAVAIVLRRHAPEGGFYSDPAWSAGVLASIATLFSVLFALVILLSVEGYKETEGHANAEADAVLEQFQLAAFLPSRHQYAVQSQLICYGQSVIELEWTDVGQHEPSTVVEGWASSLDAAAASAAEVGVRTEVAFHLFLEQTLRRQEERRGRLEGAEGALPDIVWPILILGALGIMTFLLFHADKSERLIVQAFQVGVATLLLGASLLLINALNHPFTANPGGIQPDEMRHSVEAMSGELSRSLDSASLDATLPCDEDGVPVGSDPEVRSFPRSSTMDEIVQRGKLIVGVTYGVALFGELDPLSGVVSGFDNELAKEIGREMGLRADQIEFVDILSEQRIPVLETNEVDLVIMTLTITPERQEVIVFSRPYYLAGQSLLVQKSNRSISSLRDLSGKRVCVTAGTTSVASLREKAPSAILVLAPSAGDCLTQVLAGTVDAVSTDDIILAGLALENDGLVLVGGQFTHEPYGVGIPKANTDMGAFVDSVIDRMIEDGRWGRLYYEYLADVPGLPSVSEARDRLQESRK